MRVRLLAVAIDLSVAILPAACTSSGSSGGGGGDGGAGGAGPGADAGGFQDGSPPSPDGGGLLPVGTADAAGGEACEASTDCPSGLVCMYPLAEVCSATGVCTVLAASKCAGPYCTCRGDTTAVCGDFGRLPMIVPLRGPPCGSTGVADDGGTDADRNDGGHD